MVSHENRRRRLSNGQTYPDGAAEEEERDAEPSESVREGGEDAEEGCEEERGVERRGAAHEVGT